MRIGAECSEEILGDNNLPKRKKSKSKSKSPAQKVIPAFQMTPKKSSTVMTTPVVTMKSMFGSIELDECILGDNPTESHCITESLRMSRFDVIESLPQEMQQKFFECGWIFDPKKKLHCPVLVLSPFSIKDGSIIEEWLKKYHTFTDNMERMPYLIYWYQAGASSSKDFKAFGLVPKGDIIWYDLGIQQKFHSPFEEKINSSQTLTRVEDDIMRGINQMMEDSKLSKEKRGG